MSRRRRIPGRVSEYLDTSRLDLARTKRYGILMVPDFEDEHPIDVGGWVSKRDAATNTAPATRLVAFRRNGSGNGSGSGSGSGSGGDLPLLHTPRSFGTQPYRRVGDGSTATRFGMMRAATNNEFARTLNLVRRPPRLGIDFSFPAEAAHEVGNASGMGGDTTDKTTTKKMRNKNENNGTSRKEKKKKKKKKEGEKEEDGSSPDATTMSETSTSRDIENPEEMHSETNLLEKAVDVEDDGGGDGSGSDSDSDADSDSLDAISAAARDAYPNARSGWAPSARHQAMLQRRGERQNNRRDLELHRGCRGQEKTNKQQRHQHNDPASIPGIDLSAGRAAFDPSYNHACPISIYKSRRERNSRYGFRFN